MTQELSSHKIVYLGTRLGAKNKIAYVYAPLQTVELYHDDPRALDLKSSWFAFKKKYEHVIGCVYEVECFIDDAGLIQTAKFHSAKFDTRGSFENEVYWRAQEKTVQHVKNEAALKRKLDENNPLKKNIDSLRKAYFNMPPNMRKAFLITVMKEISE